MAASGCEMAPGETRRLVEDRRGRFMVGPAGRAVEHAIKEQREGGGSIHLRRPSAMLHFGCAPF
jgi:hypothetical protein